MATWTVITVVDPDGADVLGAVNGRVDVYGHNIHTTAVGAATADDAIHTVHAAFRTVGFGKVVADSSIPYPADRWTVVGVASNGVCATANALAVIVGEHKVEGTRESMLSHRWTEMVDAPTAGAAERAGQKAADDRYNASWE